jgi:hypothetical protein
MLNIQVSKVVVILVVIFDGVFLLLLFIYSHVHTLFGSLLPPAPSPRPSPPFSPWFQAGLVLPLSLVLLKKRDKPNKEDKVFLLLELRIE